MDFVAFTAPNRPALDRWKVSINNQAHAANVPPCALAAIVMRETGGRNVLQDGMPVGPGCGVGLCQITANVNWSDKNGPTYGTTNFNMLDPSSNLYVAAEFFLAPAIKECLLLREKFGQQMNAINSEILYFAFAAYNAGFGAVQSAIWAGHDPDSFTTDHYAQGTLDFYHEFVSTAHRQRA